MAWIATLSRERQSQLERERTIDSNLQQHTQRCPEQLIHYFLTMRALNRRMAENLYKASFYEYPSKMKEHMILIDQLQEPLLKNTTCDIVRETNDRVKLELNKFLS